MALVFFVLGVFFVYHFDLYAKAESHWRDWDVFFDPADDKPYRHPSFYKVPHGVKNV